MIPGPLAHRMSSDPGLRPSPKAGGEPGPEGQSFADLLSAMLAPGAAPAAQPDAAGPEASGAVFERLDAAEMFNEQGLFRGAAPLAAESAAGTGRPGPSAAPVPLEVPGEPALSPTPGAAPPSSTAQPGIPATAADRIVAATRTASTRRSGGAAFRAAVSRSGQPASAPPVPVPARQAARETAGAERRPQAAAGLVRAYLAKGGSLSAQLTVQAVEGGISLVARADKLSREERERLRLEIGELLARHGLAAAGIIVNGEAWAAPEGGKD